MRLRIIAGKLGSRTFEAPPGHKTHPMSEKMRGAIFNALGDVSDLSVLDAYGGSGAIAFEAMSRGSKEVQVVEVDKKACDVIRSNAKNLGLSLKITRANISSWVDNNPDNRYDIVVCDPPYDGVNEVQLQKAAGVCKKNGIIVFSLPPNAAVALTSDYELLSQKDYGDATLVFYRRLR